MKTNFVKNGSVSENFNQFEMTMEEMASVNGGLTVTRKQLPDGTWVLIIQDNIKVIFNRSENEQ